MTLDQDRRYISRYSNGTLL